MFLDVLRSTRRLRNQASGAVLASLWMHRILNPRLPLYIAYAAVFAMTIAYIMFPNICLPQIIDFIQSHIGIARWYFQKLGAVCDVRHGTILVICNFIYASVTVIGCAWIILSALLNDKVYWLSGNERMKNYYKRYVRTKEYKGQKQYSMYSFLGFLFLNLLRLVSFSAETLTIRSYVPQDNIFVFICIYSFVSIFPLYLVYQIFFFRLKINHFNEEMKNDW